MFEFVGVMDSNDIHVLGSVRCRAAENNQRILQQHARGQVYSANATPCGHVPQKKTKRKQLQRKRNMKSIMQLVCRLAAHLVHSMFAVPCGPVLQKKTKRLRKHIMRFTGPVKNNHTGKRGTWFIPRNDLRATTCRRQKQKENKHSGNET